MTPVIVTRPSAEAARWVEALRSPGREVLAWPLIEFAAPTDVHGLQAARAAWLGYDALMFVSAQAVTGFFGGGLSVPSATRLPRCWAPGPGTAQALRGHGVPCSAIDAPPADAEQFDSEALWAVVKAQVGLGHRLLLVRGETAGAGDGAAGQGRDWLAQQCRAAGGQVDVCVAYRRQAPVWSPPQLAAARRALANGSLWLFSSSEALGNLASLLPGIDGAHARALATHPRIAAAARALGFGSVTVVRPALAEVRRALESEH